MNLHSEIRLSHRSSVSRLLWVRHGRQFHSTSGTYIWFPGWVGITYPGVSRVGVDGMGVGTPEPETTDRHWTLRHSEERSLRVPCPTGPPVLGVLRGLLVTSSSRHSSGNNLGGGFRPRIDSGECARERGVRTRRGNGSRTGVRANDGTGLSSTENLSPQS